MQTSFLDGSFRPSRPTRSRGGPFGWIRTGLGCAAAIVALVLLAREGLRDGAGSAPVQPVRPAVLVAPTPVWQAIPDARPGYTIDIPKLKRLAQAHEARRHAEGGREDKLVYGVFESERLYLRLVLFRGPRDPDRPASFFLDLARRAGEAGLAVVRSGRTASVETKLGALETAEVALSDSIERPCTAFRLRPVEVGFSAHGWYCAGREEVGPDLACFIDRLALLPAADADALKVLFAQAERRRNPSCGPIVEAKRRT
jgi:hypothetical protein